MIAMEERGVVQNRFKQKFRRRPEWMVDHDGMPEGKGGTDQRG
jgi:hypothetical protein